MTISARFRPGLFLLVLLYALFLPPGPAKAQSGGAPPPAKLAAPAEEPDRLLPRLRVSGAEQPVRLASLSIRTEIKGGFAESSLDMEFHNPNQRVLEGELEFPLAPGQEISGLALDISGELRRGVPVAKARGQEVFEEVARRKVDPALLEATRGNAYRLRVYPLPAGGMRRVVVRVMQPLTAENGLWRYRLPLGFAEAIDSVSIEAEVVSPAGRVQAGAGNLGLRLEKAGAVFHGRAERRNVSPEGWLDITLPAADSLSGSVTAARWRDKLYFSAAANLAVPDQARALPDRVTLLWDASGSGRERDLAREFALLDSYFQAFGSGEARLIVLRNQAEPLRTFKIKDGDWTELKTAVHELVYDGATNLTDWVPAADCREFLLFSDGLANYRSGSGAEGFPRMAPEQRLFAVNSAATADYAALRGLAAGGTVIDLAQESVESGAAKLLRAGTRVSILNAALAGAGEAALGPESAYLTSAEGPGGMIRLAGWVKAGSGAGSVPVQLVFPDGSTRETAIALPAWDETPEFTGEDAPLPARLWGRYAIANLEGDYRLNKKAIARLGQELGIVSRETSLIVLETAEDYVRYDVTPPAALQARVEALRRNKKNGGDQGLMSDDRLQALWREKVKWWETDFPVQPEPKKQEVELEAAGRPATSPAAATDAGRSQVRSKPAAEPPKDALVSRSVSSRASRWSLLAAPSFSERARLFPEPAWRADAPRSFLDAALPGYWACFRAGQDHNRFNRQEPYNWSAGLATLGCRRSDDRRFNRSAAPVKQSNSSGIDFSGYYRSYYSPEDVDRRAEPIRAVWDDPDDSYVWYNTLTFDFGGNTPAAASTPPLRVDPTYEWDGGGAQPGYMYNTDSYSQMRRASSSSSNALGQAAMVSPGSSTEVAVELSQAVPRESRPSAARAPNQEASATVGVRLKPWVADAPYIARMKEAQDEELYAVYLDERPDYLNSSAFFMDAADRFFERGLKDLGLRVLSNLAEMKLENRQILRMLAYRLMQAGEVAAALPVLEQVRELAPYEPQSLRDLALARAALGQNQAAVDLLHETGRRQWSDRFGEINTIALTEMNALIAASAGKVATEAIDSRLMANLTADIRVVLSWDLDNTDMDLWVTGPDGEQAYYRHPRTRLGGRLSRDCTRGYGPEEFMLKKAAPGLYRVEVDYYGHTRQTIAGEVTMMVTVFSKFGTPGQKQETTTLRLKKNKERVLVAEFTVDE